MKMSFDVGVKAHKLVKPLPEGVPFAVTGRCVRNDLVHAPFPEYGGCIPGPFEFLW